MMNQSLLIENDIEKLRTLMVKDIFRYVSGIHRSLQRQTAFRVPG